MLASDDPVLKSSYHHTSTASCTILQAVLKEDFISNSIVGLCFVHKTSHIGIARREQNYPRINFKSPSQSSDSFIQKQAVLGNIFPLPGTEGSG